MSPPWRHPGEGSLSLALLRPLLEREGIPADNLHATLLFPVFDAHPTIRALFSTFLWTPFLYPGTDRERLVSAAMDYFLDLVTLDGIRESDLGPDLAGADLEPLRRAALGWFDLAGVCLRRSLERAARPEYDIVGFSCTFENMIPFALAMSKELRAIRPEVKIMVGGAACFGEPADELARSFPQLDAVCHTEGDEVIAALVRALRRGQGLCGVPGISYAGPGGRVHRTPPPALTTDLDRLPEPDYDDLIEQLEASEWGAHVEPKLYFETSRGCWYGQERTCTFCAYFDSKRVVSRRKSPDRAYREIVSLHRRYPGASGLVAVDNILDRASFKTLLPRLAASGDGPSGLFYATRANLSPEHIELLAEAGISRIMPGIESLQDDILRLMRKGSAGLGQVQTLKLLCQNGVQPSWTLIIRSPNEQASYYRELGEIIQSIGHLPPPVPVTMKLLRSSPYFQNPGEHGIRDVRPRPYYAALYPDPGVDHRRIAQEFEFDHETFADEALLREHRNVVRLVDEWGLGYSPAQAWTSDLGDALLVVDRRADPSRTQRLTGAARRVLGFLFHVHGRAAVARRFGEIDPGVLSCLLDVLRHRRWLVRDGSDRYLGVLPQRGECGHASSGLGFRPASAFDHGTSR